MLKINEIYYSIQGESTKAGLPCIFIRLTSCNIRCSYCDTEYAFYEGKDMTIDSIIQEIKKYECKLVEVTGGEPLVQKESLELMRILCDEKYEVMLETGGHMAIDAVDKRVKIIMDLKCPSSKMADKNLFNNINILKPNDELKFVIGNREDYDWAVNVIDEYELNKICPIIFSTVFEKLEPAELVNWILNDNLGVRFQLQMHKFIWEPHTRGV